MSWVRHEPARGLPPGWVRVDRQGRLVFPAATCREYGLEKFHSCIVYHDSVHPGLMALQFCEDEGGDYRVSHSHGSVVLTLRGPLRRAGAQPGRYRLHQEGGLFVLDFRR